MEIIVSVAAKAAEYTVDPIKRGATFILSPGSIYRETQREYEQLQNKLNEVNNRCQQAELNGEEVTQDVNQWLIGVRNTLEQAQQFMESVQNETNISNTCIGNYMSNWVKAHRNRQDAIRHKDNLISMFGQGKNFSIISRVAPARGIHLLPGDGFIFFDSVKFAFNDIMEALRREDRSMIGVYGMGGIGKTLLVKTIIMSELTPLFKTVVVCIVSQTPNYHRIQAELGEQLCLRYSLETEFGRANQLMTRMKKEENILVVLDDVWDKIDLVKIGIPFGNDHKGCKVLFTTRRKHVCLSMWCESIIEISLLSDTESWELFKMHAGTRLTDRQLEEVAQEVTRECNGLPLALVVVASALRDKSLEVWESALMKLQRSKLKEIEDIDPERNVYDRIKLSYDFLRAELTKRCFLMCSLFPEDYEISVDVLTRYALGYGLLDAIDTYKVAKTEVKSMVSDLLAAKLLLLVKRDAMSEYVKLHDMVRDAALWITSIGEEVFVVPIPSQNNWTRDSKFLNATAISLLACPSNRRLPGAADQCSKLKMLLLAQRIPLQIMEGTFFDRMQCLQVLDITAIAARQLELVLPYSLELLSNLRTLYLRRWRLKGDLSIIGKLLSLEILSLAGSVVDELPKELMNLSELKFLDLSACTCLRGFDPVVIKEIFEQVDDFCAPDKPIVDFSYDEV